MLNGKEDFSWERPNGLNQLMRPMVVIMAGQFEVDYFKNKLYGGYQIYLRWRSLFSSIHNGYDDEVRFW